MINRRKTPDKSQSVEQEPTVYVLDDDENVQDGVKALLDSVGLRSRILSSPEEFRREDIDTANCLILDVRLPGVSELDSRKSLPDQELMFPSFSSQATGTFRWPSRR